MIRKILAVALLAVAGCSDRIASNESSTAELEPAVAILSCSINGSPIGITACLAGGGQTIGGNLKITNGGTVRQYTDQDLFQEARQANGPTLRIPLAEPFEIVAQANSDEGYVLGLTIQRGSKTVFQDQTTQFGVIHVNNDSLD